MRNRLVAGIVWACTILSLMGAANSCGNSPTQPSEAPETKEKATSAPRQYSVEAQAIEIEDGKQVHKLLLCCEGEGTEGKFWYVINPNDVRAYWEPCVPGKLFIPSEYEQGLSAGCGLTAP